MFIQTEKDLGQNTPKEKKKQFALNNTPQPLYNITVGVHSINRVR